MDRLTEMEAFLTVVDQGGFTGAARKLGISKSAVSKHVASLEARLGVQLLTRTTRRVDPTEAGLFYYDRARQVLDQASEADETVASLEGAPTGFVRIASTADFGTNVVSPALARFLDAYSEIKADLVLTDAMVELVAEGFDLAIRVGRIPQDGSETVEICQVPYRVVGSPEYVARMGRPERLEDLTEHELLRKAQTVAVDEWSLTAPSGEIKVLRSRGRLAVNDGGALADAAVAGLGLAFLPAFLVDQLIVEGKLEQVATAMPKQVRSVYAVLPPGPYTPPKVRALIDFLVRECQARAQDWPADGPARG